MDGDNYTTISEFTPPANGVSVNNLTASKLAPEYSKDDLRKNRKTIFITCAIILIVAYTALCSVAISIAFVEIYELKSEEVVPQWQEPSFMDLQNKTLQMNDSINAMIYLNQSQKFAAGLQNEMQQLNSSLNMLYLKHNRDVATAVQNSRKKWNN